MPGATLFRINGLSTVWANAEVPESQASLLRVGAAVEARTPAIPGVVFKGNVQAILPEVNATTRTLKARVELVNAGGALSPGMFVNIALSVSASEGLMIPTEAVIRTGTRNVVMVAEGDGKFTAGGSDDRIRGQRTDADYRWTGGRTAGRGLGPVPARFGSQPQVRRHPHGGTRAQRWRKSHDRRADPLVDRQPLPGAARDGHAHRRGACGRCRARRSTRCPTCPTCRSSSARRYPGQAPQIVENQVTYPLTTTMLSVPGAKTVRGYSFFGDSFVYVLFEDGTDLYWARSRVLEYLNQVQSRLPAQAQAVARARTRPAWAGSTSTRWSIAAGSTTSSQLRALQDWFLQVRAEDACPNVAEVASVGGMVRQYQVVLDPDRLRAYGITARQGDRAPSATANQETGGSVLELAEAEYMVRASRLPASRSTTSAASRCDGDAAASPVRLRRRRARPGRPGDAPRHRRARRRRRSRRRHHRHALGQERARDHRRR